MRFALLLRFVAIVFVATLLLDGGNLWFDVTAQLNLLLIVYLLYGEPEGENSFTNCISLSRLSEKKLFS